MMRKVYTLPLALLIVTIIGAQAQQLPVYNQFFFNYSLYNPSFIGKNGFTEVYLNQRHQWVGIEGAPVTTNINFQLPLTRRVSVGAFLFSDKTGLLYNYQGDLGISYEVPLGRSTSLTFGLAAGMERNTVDKEVTDPQLVNARGSRLTGQFGAHLQWRKLMVSFAMPKLFESDILTELNVQQTGLAALKTTFASIAYEFAIAQTFSVKPTLYYLTDMTFVNQYGGQAALYYKNIAWIGGGYREHAGADAFIGFSIKDKIRVGYAYEFASNLADKLGNGSHEIQISVRLGKTNKKASPLVAAEEPDTSEVVVAQQQEVKKEQPKDEPKDEPVQQQQSEPVIEQTPVQQEPQPIVVEETKEEIAKTPDNIVEVQSDRSGEMPPGYYVVTGAFREKPHAEAYLARIRNAGYSGSVGLNKLSNLYYVYITYTGGLEQAKEKRDEIRKINMFEFPKAWLLKVE